MDRESRLLAKEVLDAQNQHWESTFSQHPDMYGLRPSEPARKAAEMFKREGMANILELGGGQGRDSIFFAGSALKVQVLDYSEAGVEAIARKANDLAMTDSITAMRHDIRIPLPFDNGSFDSCFSHMLFSMALSNSELHSLSEEVRRVLKAGG